MKNIILGSLAIVLALTGCGLTNTPVFDPSDNTYIAIDGFRPVLGPINFDLFGSDEIQMLALINTERVKGHVCVSSDHTQMLTFPPAKPLKMEGHLHVAAQGHSRDMSDRNYFDHIAPKPAPDGTTPIERIALAGFRPPTGLSTGENIANANIYHWNEQQIVDAWLVSFTHCVAMMDDYNYAGVASWNGYWTLDMAK